MLFAVGKFLLYYPGFNLMSKEGKWEKKKKGKKNCAQLIRYELKNQGQIQNLILTKNSGALL